MGDTRFSDGLQGLLELLVQTGAGAVEFGSLALEIFLFYGDRVAGGRERFALRLPLGLVGLLQFDRARDPREGDDLVRVGRCHEGRDQAPLAHWLSRLPGPRGDDDLRALAGGQIRAEDGLGDSTLRAR